MSDRRYKADVGSSCWHCIFSTFRVEIFILVAWSIYLPSHSLGLCKHCACRRRTIKFFRFFLSLPGIHWRKPMLLWLQYCLVGLACLCGRLRFSLISGIRMSDRKHILSRKMQGHWGCWEMSTISNSSLTAVAFNTPHGGCVLMHWEACPLACICAVSHLCIRFLWRSSHSGWWKQGNEDTFNEQLELTHWLSVYCVNCWCMYS